MDGGVGKKGPVTSSQVARLAGVSQSAVSRSFTPGASIAPKTRAKVLEAAKALGYRPNAIARSLITSRSRIIAVVMAYLENLFYPDVLEELGRRLAAENYHLLLFTGFKDRDSDPVFDQLMQYRVDGIILASTSLSSELSEECAAAGIPVVLFNRTTERDAVSSVTTQNREGARKLADFLVAGGHKTFGYISGLENSSTNRDRFEGFREGLAAHGFTDIIVRTGNYSRADAETAARQLFALENRPEAVFVANDHMAVAVMDVARYEFGLTIPDDLSVVGYDDVGPARWPAYGITTVTQPIEGMVEAAVRILMTQIASGEMISEHELLPGELIVRTSAIRPRNGIVTVDGQNLYRPEAQ
ncbi:LacI family DNA-binding transcriptional regulator [Pelagibacterium nitratireducens]|jgi:DNA-binding LacI/PurR family transcriptional regulator|uniref:LacI family DNA-binding transcriptional regulator n=1 Tax=Pelagibacterium nitratireducens TaxID=1046114 RepID=A0ABZ2HZU1_9HYPH|tara:strand:+ start:29116 stop:30189 length:1074 start_codon:yes stop_codon:yes gene_type:complete